jgi:20S proteasome alpha/beta subunit
MTVICWDGKTLAADKRATSVGLARTVTKVQRHGDVLLAMTGDWDVAAEMREWFKAGAVPREFPAKAREDNASLIVVGRGSLAVYSTGPFPIPIESEKAAFGSGRDFAEAAMYLGCTAVEAVSVACHFQADCGNGIDALTLD